MPPENKKWDIGRKALKTNRQIRRILILCEDTKSSRDYLAQFPHDKQQVQIECKGTGMNTDSLVEYALDLKQKAEYSHAPYQSMWIVFDKDDFDLQKFNRAFDLARAHPAIYVCWANECFELWYLLHFELRQTSTARNDVCGKLSEHLTFKYSKADIKLFQALNPKIDEALANAKRLEGINSDMGEVRRNPSTNVHLLIKTLRDFNPQRQIN
jgi:hypothetical protein